MNQLFSRKPIADLIPEGGERGLKRVMGAGDLIMLAIGAVIGAGIFSSIGTAAAGEVLPSGEVVRYGAGPALVVSFILLGGRLRARGALLCRAGVDDSAGRQRLRLLVRDAGRAGRLDHRLGPDPRVRGRQHRRGDCVERLFQLAPLGRGHRSPGLADARLSHGAAQLRPGRPRAAADGAAAGRHPRSWSTCRPR